MEATLSVFKTETVAVDMDDSSTANGWLGIGSLRIGFILVTVNMGAVDMSKVRIFLAPATMARSDSSLKDVDSQMSSVWLEMLISGSRSESDT